ncbi:MAG: hypothetical protein M1343_06390 [Chloroflexi bacterium]|nr:hypothetical protein [Chloroflexota bacterium]MDA8188022.1 hypothetical protein [Dehalococcoidales bacterium]
MIPFDTQRPDPTNESQQEGRGTRPYSPVQLLFLLRLARLLRQRQEYVNVLSAEDWRLKLLNKAIYSTYCDCIEQGIGDDAKALFERDKATNRT